MALSVSSSDQASVFTLHRDVCNFILNEVSKIVNYFKWVMEKGKKKGKKRKREKKRQTKIKAI